MRKILAIQEGFKELLQIIENSFDTSRGVLPRPFLQQLAEEATDYDQNELFYLVAGLVVAAHTISETIAYILCRLLRGTASEKALVCNTDWVDKHLETLLRLYPSTLLIGRVATQDGEINKCPVHAGDHIWVDVPSVNRDPNAFPISNGENISLDEKGSSDHLSFGAGSHKCPGAALARLTIRNALPMLLNRFPDLALRKDEIQWHESATMIKAPTSLPCNLNMTDTSENDHERN